MYQNLKHYVLIVALRLNNVTNFVTVLYYMKFIKKNKIILSWHINLNVNNFLKKRDKNRIQSLTVFEKKFNELKIKYFINMHRTLKKWWNVIKTWKLIINDYMCALTSEMMTNQNFKNFKIKKDIVNCSAKNIIF